MKNILVLGSSGFIGKNLINFLSSTNEYQIHTFVRSESMHTNNHQINTNIQIHQVNLEESNRIEKILTEQKINIVIHLSSSLKPNSDVNSFNYECKNIISPSVRLISLCSKLEIMFVYFSSGGAIYGNGNDRPHIENDSLKPISYYGLAKYYIEEAIRLEHRSTGLKYLILRPSNPFGPGQNLNANQGLIAVTLGKIYSQEKLTIWGDGSSIRDYIYIEDLCAYVHKLLCLDCKNKTFNVGSGEGVSVKKIVEVIYNTLNIQPNVEYIDPRVFDVDSSILNISYLEDHIGELVITPLEKGISSFADFIIKGDL
jgi:UDP-glucose 4-epimerase